VNIAKVQVFDDSPNYVVLKTEGRRFPGLVVQGDSLSNLVNLSGEAQNAIRNRDFEEAEEVIEELHDQLLEKIQHYERVLLSNHVELPYSQRFTD
jgi:hypothetical protein